VDKFEYVCKNRNTAICLEDNSIIYLNPESFNPETFMDNLDICPIGPVVLLNVHAYLDTTGNSQCSPVYPSCSDDYDSPSNASLILSIRYQCFELTGLGGF